MLSRVATTLQLRVGQLDDGYGVEASSNEHKINSGSNPRSSDQSKQIQQSDASDHAKRDQSGSWILQRFCIRNVDGEVDKHRNRKDTL